MSHCWTTRYRRDWLRTDVVAGLQVEARLCTVLASPRNRVTGAEQTET